MCHRYGVCFGGESTQFPGICEVAYEISTLGDTLYVIGIFLPRFGMSTAGLESHRVIVIAVSVPAVPYKQHRLPVYFASISFPGLFSQFPPVIYTFVVFSFVLTGF